MRAYAEARGNIVVYVATLEHINVLAVTREEQQNSLGQSLYDRSFATACLDTTVDYEFVVVPDAVLQELEVDSGRQFVSNGTNAITPTRVTIRSSSSSGDGEDSQVHCERTLHALGIAALIYSTRVTWRLSSAPASSIHTPVDDIDELPFAVDRTTASDVTQRLSQLSQRRRFHSYVIAIARRYFPIEAWKQPPYDNCPDMPVVGDGTPIAVDADFYFLAVTMGVCFVLIVAALLLWLRLPRQAWRVATATEWLATLRYGNVCGDDCGAIGGRTQKQGTSLGEVDGSKTCEDTEGDRNRNMNVDNENKTIVVQRRRRGEVKGRTKAKVTSSESSTSTTTSRA